MERSEAILSFSSGKTCESKVPGNSANKKRILQANTEMDPQNDIQGQDAAATIHGQQQRQQHLRSAERSSPIPSTPKSNEHHHEIASCTMSPSVRELAISVILDAMATTKVEKDIATKIKRKFDDSDGGTWHCIVGKDFGVSLCFDANNLIFLKTENKHVLLFKSFELDKHLLRKH